MNRNVTDFVRQPRKRVRSVASLKAKWKEMTVTDSVKGLQGELTCFALGVTKPPQLDVDLPVVLIISMVVGKESKNHLWFKSVDLANDLKHVGAVSVSVPRRHFGCEPCPATLTNG